MWSLPLCGGKAQTHLTMGKYLCADPVDGTAQGRDSMSFATGLKTIVVATDLEGVSEAALEYARKLATAYGARIVLAHGTDPLEYAAVDAVPGRVLRGLSEEARSTLDQMGAE